MQRAHLTEKARDRSGVAGPGFAPGHARYAPDAERLREAAHGLRDRSPELSASTGLWRWQKGAIVCLAVLLGGGVLLVPEATLVALLAVMAIPFLFVVALRAAALWQLFGYSSASFRADPDREKDGALPV